MVDSLGLRGSGQPCAIMERKIVQQVNPAAAEQGVAHGQSATTALSLCPQLEALPRQPLAEQQLLQQAALWSYRFSPLVSIDLDQATLYTELRGSLRLFKGFNRLYHYYSQAFARRNIQFCTGLAYTPSAAYLLSYAHQPPAFYRRSGGELDHRRIHQQLQQLPVTLLPCNREVVRTLQSSGIRQLEPLFSLPKAALGKRFGADFCQLIGYIKGTEPELRAPYQPTETFFSRRQFNGTLDSKQQLQLPMQELLAELKVYLRLRQCINRELRWQLYYSDGGEDSLLIHSSHGVFQQRALMELSRLKLDGFTLAANVEAIALGCDRFEHSMASNGKLFALDTAPAAATEREENYRLVLDKLRTRLDKKHCYTLSEQNHLLPEKAWAAVDSQMLRPVSTKPLAPAPPRPLWLLHQPQAISGQRDKLYWQGPMQLLQGPERIDNEWWQRRQARDYYVARHCSGALYWVYRDQLNHRWFVHGLFA